MNLIRENLINNSENLHSTNLLNAGLDGGRNQEWKIINKIISQRSKKPNSPIFEEGKVKLKYDLRKIKRTDFPIILDPKTASFSDVAIHCYLRQRLSQNTIEKRLSTARFMETHPQPVDFRNPTYENFS